MPLNLLFLSYPSLASKPSAAIGLTTVADWTLPGQQRLITELVSLQNWHLPGRRQGSCMDVIYTDEDYDSRDKKTQQERTGET